MKFNKLFFLSLGSILISFLIGASAFAYAPSSLIGKKVSVSYTDSGRNYQNDNYFTNSSHAWQFEYENGDWESKNYIWSYNGSSGTLKWDEFPTGGWAMVANATFSSSNSGTINWTEYELNESGNLEIEYEGTASFTVSDYSNSDLPPLDTYFSDDFTSVSTSQNYWYENIEISWNGLQFSLGDGELELLGTGTNPSELSFDANARTLVSVEKDWEIQAEAYANYPATGSETWNAKVGFEMENSGLDFEFFIGPSSSGTHAHINFGDSLGYVHLSTSFDNLKQGNYRIRNDTASKTFHAETLSASTWNTVMSINWETGAVSGATYSTSGNTSQVSNWVSMASKYVQPGVEFLIPSDSGTIKTLSENQLGFDSFSIISTNSSSTGGSVTAPTSLVGKIYQESFYDSFYEEQLTDTINIFSDTQYFGRLERLNGGLINTSLRNYQWSASDSQGTFIVPSSTSYPTSYTYDLIFNSETSGTSSYTTSDGYSSTGTFTLNDALSVNVPSSLVGKILTESFYADSLSENFTQIMYFQSDTELLEIQEGEVSGLYSIYNPSYTFSVSGNIGTLITSTGTDTAVYTLLFTSETGGYSDYSNSYSDILSSGSFNLSDSTDGYSPGDLVNDQLVISGETYIFKANNVCTIRSGSGSIDSTYRFIKTGQNTAVLSIPADDAAGPDSILGTADDVIATKYKLTFSSSSSGTISGGRAGNFSYYPEGTSAPSTKGWMWFDEYPWVYSHVEGGWLYFNPLGSKLIVFSVKDQAWREMTK